MVVGAVSAESDRPLFDEGDEVLLRAKVYRANTEQALIEFRSMEGPFSVRVPLAELQHGPPPEEAGLIAYALSVAVGDGWIDNADDQRRAKALEERFEALSKEEEDPCCLLYKQFYLQDHEYQCPARMKKEGREMSAWARTFE